MNAVPAANDALHHPGSELPPAPGLSCYIVARDAKAAIDFYKTAFGATLVHCFYEPGTNRVVHSILGLGGGTLYLSDDFPAWTHREGLYSPVLCIPGKCSSKTAFIMCG